MQTFFQVLPQPADIGMATPPLALSIVDGARCCKVKCPAKVQRGSIGALVQKVLKTGASPAVTVNGAEIDASAMQLCES